MTSSLLQAGAQVTEEAGTLVVTGVDTDTIGQLAFDRSIVIYEIAAVRASLEDTFLDLTTGAGHPTPGNTHVSEETS
jgi:ABC-2 type transport system ATP-binding protein